MIRFVVLLVSLVATSALAVERIGNGVGTTEAAARQNAKQDALSQVTGEFVVNKLTAHNGELDHQQAQYSGGVVRKWTDRSITFDGRLYSVQILADIDPNKNNRMVVVDDAMSEDDRQTIIENHERISNITEFATKLDDYHQAFVAVPGRITYNVRGSTTDVNILLGVKLSPKWVDDVLTLSKEAGKRINTDTPMSDVLWGVGSALAPVHILGASVIRSAAHFVEKPQQVDIESNCFSQNNSRDVDECYALGYMFGNVVRKDRFVVTVRFWSQGDVVAERDVVALNSNQLFVLYDIGTSLYFRYDARERKFMSRGILWFKDGVASGRQSHQIDTNVLATVDQIDYVLR